MRVEDRSSNEQRTKVAINLHLKGDKEHSVSCRILVPLSEVSFASLEETARRMAIIFCHESKYQEGNGSEGHFKVRFLYTEDFGFKEEIKSQEDLVEAVSFYGNVQNGLSIEARVAKKLNLGILPREETKMPITEHACKRAFDYGSFLGILLLLFVSFFWMRWNCCEAIVSLKEGSIILLKSQLEEFSHRCDEPEGLVQYRREEMGKNRDIFGQRPFHFEKNKGTLEEDQNLKFDPTSEQLISLMKSQLNELKAISRKMIAFKAFFELEELKGALDIYMIDNSPHSHVAQTYGYPINRWDVSRVTSFRELFDSQRNPKTAEFNEDLSGWDVSRGTDFVWMFFGASKFNGDISSWNMSSAQTTAGMFRHAESFNSDVSRWDVSNVDEMGMMFYGASSFNSNIQDWNVSKVTSMYAMFGPKLQQFRDQVSSWHKPNIRTEGTIFSHV